MQHATCLSLGAVSVVTARLPPTWQTVCHIKRDQEGFDTAIAQAPEVRECHNVTGTCENLLRVETADLSSLQHFHTGVLGAQRPFVRNISFAESPLSIFLTPKADSLKPTQIRSIEYAR